MAERKYRIGDRVRWKIHGGTAEGRIVKIATTDGSMSTHVPDSIAGKAEQKTPSRLGLVCITRGEEIRYRTITRARFRALSRGPRERWMRELQRAARQTWPNPEWQIIHISNGDKSLHDLRHTETIAVLPESALEAEWVEIEAKGKEIAIENLRARYPELR